MKFQVIGEGYFKNKTYEYEKSEYYCINCGSQEVYSDVQVTEFYEGRLHICLSCEFGFYIPLTEDDNSNFINQIRSQLKESD